MGLLDRALNIGESKQFRDYEKRVALIGAFVLHGGNIAEMKTGEGKTLTGTLAVVLNALAGKGVHVVTVNDYLARRDAAWMSPIYDFLGLTVGVLQNMQSYEDKHVAYAA